MGKRSKILIIDDKPENLIALEGLLEPLQVSIVKAASGNEALAATLSHDFALVISDVQMPGMDGYELAQLLRGIRKTCHIPIIFLTAVYSDEMHIFQGYETGAVDFITKPFRPEILLSKARVFLELDRSRRDLIKHKNDLEKLIGKYHQINEHLQLEISERLAMEGELQKAKQEAEGASVAKSEFLANMSHEIRTPMNGILGMTELILSEEISPQARRYLQLIKQSGSNLLTIINDILDLAKIEAGGIDISAQEFGLREAVEDTLLPLAMNLGSKRVTLEHAVGHDVPDHLIGDQVRLRQILTNLVGNAIKFTTEGQVTVSVDLKEDPDQNIARLLFRVSDTGIGIPADKAKHIFESFGQVGSSSHAQHEGTGLGLTISKRLVEKMGGTLELESEVGKGSTFSFTTTFGIARERMQPAADARPAAPAPAWTLRILLAEDNVVNQVLAEELLRQRGHQIEVAGNGREALEKLKAGRFDLVLMDVRMPDMDGLAALQAIRRGEAGRDNAGIKVVALTAHALKGDREQLIGKGMDDYLSKPIDVEELNRVLTHVMAKHTPAA